MDATPRYPAFRQVVLDSTDARRLADFYRELLGFRYRPGDESPRPDGEDFLVIHDSDGRNRIAFQQVDRLTPTTWPDDTVPQQMHLDLFVTSKDDLDHQHDRALSLGARLIQDRSDDEDEPLRVYADPAGHPFCIFVA